MNHSSKLTFTLALAVIAIGGFMFSSSSSQEPKQADNQAELGRYQMPDGRTMVDTKTGRSWVRFESQSDYRWEERVAPWNKTKYDQSDE
jgi:hypothetical protein